MSISLNNSYFNKLAFTGEKSRQNNENVKMRPVYNEFAKKVAIGTTVGAVAGGIIGAVGGPVGTIAGAELGAGLTSIHDAMGRAKQDLPGDNSKRNTLIMGGMGLFYSMGSLWMAANSNGIKNGINNAVESYKEFGLHCMEHFVSNNPTNKFLLKSNVGTIKAFYIAAAVAMPILSIGAGAICSAALKGIKSLCGVGKKD
ncbi:MAG: hypothetical protein WCK67_12440 [bacterium]